MFVDILDVFDICDKVSSDLCILHAITQVKGNDNDRAKGKGIGKSV